MEAITSSSTESKLRADEEEDAIATKILEIINGKTADNSKATEDEDREVWSMEMGDDSVFYSDEEQVHQDKESAILTGFRAKRSKYPANSEADGETNQQMEDNSGVKCFIYKEDWEMEKEINHKVIWTEEENQKLAAFKTKRMYLSDPEEAAAGSDVTPGKFVKTSGESEQQDKVAANVDQVKKEEPMTEADTSCQHLLLSNDDCIRLNGALKLPQRPSEADSKKPSDMQLIGDAQAESLENPKQVHSNLPLPKKTDSCTFNHVASSKYSTVSYRRIRKGNTRQRIEEFEFLFTNKN